MMKGMMGKKKRLGMVLTAWLATLMHAMATCMPTSVILILCQIHVTTKVISDDHNRSVIIILITIIGILKGNMLSHTVAACPA